MGFEKVEQLQQLAKEITSEFYIKLNDENNSVILEQKKDNTKWRWLSLMEYNGMNLLYSV